MAEDKQACALEDEGLLGLKAWLKELWEPQITTTTTDAQYAFGSVEVQLASRVAAAAAVSASATEAQEAQALELGLQAASKINEFHSRKRKHTQVSHSSEPQVSRPKTLESPSLAVGHSSPSVHRASADSPRHLTWIDAAGRATINKYLYLDAPSKHLSMHPFMVPLPTYAAHPHPGFSTLAGSNAATGPLNRLTQDCALPKELPHVPPLPSAPRNSLRAIGGITPSSWSQAHVAEVSSQLHIPMTQLHAAKAGATMVHQKQDDLSRQSALGGVLSLQGDGVATDLFGRHSTVLPGRSHKAWQGNACPWSSLASQTHHRTRRSGLGEQAKPNVQHAGGLGGMSTLGLGGGIQAPPLESYRQHLGAPYAVLNTSTQSLRQRLGQRPSRSWRELFGGAGEKSIPSSSLVPQSSLLRQQMDTVEKKFQALDPPDLHQRLGLPVMQATASRGNLDESNRLVLDTAGALCSGTLLGKAIAAPGLSPDLLHAFSSSAVSPSLRESTLSGGPMSSPSRGASTGLAQSGWDSLDPNLMDACMELLHNNTLVPATAPLPASAKYFDDTNDGQLFRMLSLAGNSSNPNSLMTQHLLEQVLNVHDNGEMGELSIWAALHHGPNA